MEFMSAVIKPFKLDYVRKSLSDIGVQRVTVTEVRVFGRQKRHTDLFQGAEYAVDYCPRSNWRWQFPKI